MLSVALVQSAEFESAGQFEKLTEARALLLRASERARSPMMLLQLDATLGRVVSEMLDVSREGLQYVPEALEAYARAIAIAREQESASVVATLTRASMLLEFSAADEARDLPTMKTVLARYEAFLAETAAIDAQGTATHNLAYQNLRVATLESDPTEARRYANRALALYRQTLALRTTANLPMHRATTTMSIGYVYKMLWERFHDPADFAAAKTSLESAIAALDGLGILDAHSPGLRRDYAELIESGPGR